jgi:hypothetical protein
MGLASAIEMTPEVEAQIAKALRHRDGWWVQAVLAGFEPIAREYGYEVESVTMHFRGHVVLFRGSTHLISLGFDTEGGSLTGDLSVLEDLPMSRYPRGRSIPRLLTDRAPNEQWEAPTGARSLTEPVVRSVLERWAAGLVAYASDVLEGEIPEEMGPLSPPWSQAKVDKATCVVDVVVLAVIVAVVAGIRSRRRRR